MKQFDPIEYRIFEATTGSHLYGLSTPESDSDSRGVCVAPMEVLLDPFMRFTVKDGFDGEDRAIYDLGKFMNLCADNNPNLLELLFVPEQFVLCKTKEWDKVIENRHLFLSKNVKHRFLGYGFSQLEAIKRHRAWFLNPPSHKPTREEFGLSQEPLVSEANIQNMMGVPNHLFKEEYYQELQQERLYRETKKKWDNYMQWKTNRNPKRKGTEEQFGYDLKYASHLFRLMSEGKELLLTGKITFPLPNAEWLLEIKQGLYPYEQILEMAENMEKEFEIWYEQSPLPKTPDRNALKELYFDIVLGEK
jgi:uncharacterized protein